MADAIAISGVRFAASTAADRARGLLGFASFVVGPVRVDSVAVRRTRNGRLALSFPARRDRYGFQHAFVQPVDEATRRAIEAAVFAALPSLDERGAS